MPNKPLKDFASMQSTQGWKLKLFAGVGGEKRKGRKAPSRYLCTRMFDCARQSFFSSSTPFFIRLSPDRICINYWKRAPHCVSGIFASVRSPFMTFLPLVLLFLHPSIRIVIFIILLIFLNKKKPTEECCVIVGNVFDVGAECVVKLIY